MRTRSFVACALVACACEAEPASKPAPPSKPAVVEPAPPAKPPQPRPEPAEQAPQAKVVPLPAAGAAGPAYFVVQDKGVVVLDGGTFAEVEGGPKTLVRGSTLGGDGTAYLLTFTGILSVKGTSAKKVALTPQDVTGTLDHLAVTTQGELWVAGQTRFGHYENAAWSMQGLDALGAGAQRISGLAVDDADGVWLATAGGLFHREGAGAFVAVPLPASVGEIGGVSRGTDPSSMLAWGSGALARLEGTKSTVVPFEGVESPTFGALNLAANRIGVLRTGAKSVARLHGKDTVTPYAAPSDFEGTEISAVGIDGSGRTWLATDAGITVLGPHAERARWPMGAVPEIAGRVVGIVVLGAGPALPEVGAPQTSSLVGTIYLDDKPLGGAKVQLCPSPARSIKRTPCEDAPIKLDGQTDAAGKFTFSEVPLGAYGLGVQVGDTWKITFAGQYGAQMVPEQTYDIGKLKFNSGPKGQDDPGSQG